MAVVLAIAISAVAAQPVAGFSIDVSLTNGTPNDRSDDLLDAARWSDRSGSFVEDGVRGLGGGLEYSVSTGFCDNLIPRFVDSPTCEDLTLSIQQSFDIWGEDHPKLRFEDVTGRVDVELPPSGASDPWRGYGSEIDILALSPDQYASVRGYGAWTQFWYLFADPVGTNGSVLPGNSLTSADIVVNTEACFYLDPEAAVEGCNDFAFLMLHETGHVFALDHSNVEENGSFDSDFDPLNSMSVDCESPHDGLALSDSVNPESVMNLDRWEQARTLMALSADELGALQFLYPVCSDAGDLGTEN
ncbi:MAG: hypothetical protein O2913_04660 [Chloroflexi bacterium]|nr:hypothetical protein [Chloroflexota bacterium]